jgi:hypothetical protein
MGYLTPLAFACLTIAAAASGRRPRAGLWYGWTAALLLAPVRMAAPLGIFLVDARSIAGVLGVARAATARPGPGAARRRPSGSDALIVALVGSMLLSQVLAGELRPKTPIGYATGWLVPYLAGRLFVRSAADVPRALRAVAVGTLLLATLSIVEALTHVNPWTTVLGGSGDPVEDVRAGLRRAHGPLDGPIVLGMLLVLLLPWASEASRRARDGAGPGWWQSLPWLAGVALVGTVSRGPILAGLATVLGTAFLRHRRRRALIAVAALAGAVLAVAAREVVVGTMTDVAGEDFEQTVEINGTEYQYSGSLHRLLLFEVYGEPLAHAGLFGYGHHMGGGNDGEDVGKFWSIDCHYLMFTLQYGYAGTGLFVLLLLGALADLVRAARGGGAGAGLAGPMFVAMLAVSLNMFTVWFAPDYGAAWLFTAGLAASLRELAAEPVGAAPGPLMS